MMVTGQDVTVRIMGNGWILIIGLILKSNNIFGGLALGCDERER